MAVFQLRIPSLLNSAEDYRSGGALGFVFDLCVPRGNGFNDEFDVDEA